MGGLTRSRAELEADDLAANVEKVGATPVAQAPAGEPVTIQGKLRSVSMRPHQGVPATVADLYDGTGHLQLIWLGRRRIRGIEPGRIVQVVGRFNLAGSHRRMYNPRYTLMPFDEAAQ